MKDHDHDIYENNSFSIFNNDKCVDIMKTLILKLMMSSLMTVFIQKDEGYEGKYGKEEGC